MSITWSNPARRVIQVAAVMSGVMLPEQSRTKRPAELMRKAEELKMSFTQSPIDLDENTNGARTTLRETQETPSEQRPRTVLDDPSLRRLLRDGHCADATAFLLTQLENEE